MGKDFNASRDIKPDTESSDSKDTGTDYGDNLAKDEGVDLNKSDTNPPPNRGAVVGTEERIMLHAGFPFQRWGRMSSEYVTNEYGGIKNPDLAGRFAQSVGGSFAGTALPGNAEDRILYEGEILTPTGATRSIASKDPNGGKGGEPQYDLDNEFGAMIENGDAKITCASFVVNHRNYDDNVGSLEDIEEYSYMNPESYDYLDGSTSEGNIGNGTIENDKMNTEPEEGLDYEDSGNVQDDKTDEVIGGEQKGETDNKPEIESEPQESESERPEMETEQPDIETEAEQEDTEPEQPGPEAEQLDTEPEQQENELEQPNVESEQPEIEMEQLDIEAEAEKEDTEPGEPGLEAEQLDTEPEQQEIEPEISESSSDIEPAPELEAPADIQVDDTPDE